MTKAPPTTSQAPPQPAAEFSREQVELLNRTVCKGASDDELRLFLNQCKRTGLDPFARQIYAIKRWDSREKREVMQAQASIDGFRLIADRSGKYEGQLGPLWCGADGKWVDVWLKDTPPSASKVGVLKTGCREPFWSVAKYAEYVQTDRDGNPVSMWRKMPANQLAKCSEALSLRKAFPQEMSGLYTADELDQADRDLDPPSIVNVAAPPPQSNPQQVKPEAPARPWRSFRGMINEFAKLHGRLGPDYDHLYRETLREFNVEHSNQFKDSGQAVACYGRLLERVRECEAAAAEESAMIDAAEMLEEIQPPEEEANA
jgi:phage recombination protein Bet